MSSISYDIIEIFSSHLCRAARGLLGWSQAELADRAHVGRSTLADFERGRRIPIRNNIVAIVTALEEGGVKFIGPDPAGKEGVRLRRM
ncbi:transcriptional regulator, y4mF family [alpha proteobacterium Q-1]|uniref:helix-turn-helix domain-containing protein n=1 Tax=Iodidimonas nitroreducens TaxID=1236968 RepID=UPI0004A05711|nr:transcriptional regulator, y4mF family [alpha proteobacterium Q-1]